jgi:hypothetical protein
MSEIMARFGVPEDRRSEVSNPLPRPHRGCGRDGPRGEVVALSTRDPPAESLVTVREGPHTRFVLVDEGLDDPVGVVYVPALVRSWAATPACGTSPRTSRRCRRTCRSAT